MKGTQLMELFAVAAILSSCTSAVCADPTESLHHDSRAVETLACQAPALHLGQVLEDFLTQGVDAYKNLPPAIATPPKSLTPQEASKVQAFQSQEQKFYSVSLPEIISLLNTNPSLTPAQVEQVNDVVSQRILQLAAVNCLIEEIAPKYNYSCAQKQSVLDIASTGGDLFGAILSLERDSKGQPTISPAQAEEIKKLVAKNQELFETANELFNVPKPIPAPSQSLGTLLQEVLTQGKNVSKKLRPTAGNINKDQLTPSELDELKAILMQSQNFYKVLLPCVVDKLNSNATLTPAQVQQVKDVLSQRVTMLTAVKYLIGDIGPKLNYNCVQQKTITDLATIGIDLYGEFLGVVENTNVQPTLSPAQLAQINKLIADNEKALQAAFVAFNVGPTSATLPTTTTTTTTTAPSPKAH